ncbi:hypothetical protein MYSTI_04849 [Myxococcus stipitatus DSM 14675]|uniref:Uncharacterized protein n=1 Tax=Myxococcus stipitatus (strain DSM 14675 / JCM 12634 / Mx s8) TaxID=1278073 RepID=L7UDJ8_MYXSD|nr:hypothetical protein [Myxococcus stipitatus]AGC46138.1 hypothetical protein MYSTI_04849 [Myxococcus stipitatus DSM 14675]
MHPSGEAAWPESLRSLYEGVASTSDAEAVAASVPRAESFAQWVSGASLEERNQAQLAAWARLAQGERGLAELMFLVGSCGELLWPYEVAPSGLLERLLSRQAAMLSSLRAAGELEVATRLLRETEATVSSVLTRIVKRHPDSLGALVGRVPCTFNGSVLRFMESVELDLKRVMATGAKAIGMLEQLRALLPATAEGGRDKLAEFIRSRASRIPWAEASEILAERLFSLATAPEGRGGMRGFLACYPNGRKEPEWCERAGVLLARTLEVGGSPAVVENLCELLGRFDSPPVDGLRGALGALVGSEFEATADLGPARFVVDHCLATLRKGEPGLVLTLVWLEERLFRASVRKGLTDAFERRKRIRTKLEPLAPAFAQLCWLAEECAELWPRLKADARPGMDELAAWRDEVAERVGRKPMLRKAAIEFFLWCAPDAASSEAELTVLSLVRTETDRRQIRKLKDHPSSRVRLRVRTLQRWFQGAGKEGPQAAAPTGAVAPASITEALRHLHQTRAVPMGGRTWLKDRDLEELAHGAVARVEADFSLRYPELFREDTVELVGTLLEGLREEMGRVKADLFTLLAQGQPPPLDFELTVRRGRGAEPEAQQVAAPGQEDLLRAVVAPSDDALVVDGGAGTLSASESETDVDAGERWELEQDVVSSTEVVADESPSGDSALTGDTWVRLDMGFSSVTSVDEAMANDVSLDEETSTRFDDGVDPSPSSDVGDDGASAFDGFSEEGPSQEFSVAADTGLPADASSVVAVTGDAMGSALDGGEATAPIDGSSPSTSESTAEDVPESQEALPEPFAPTSDDVAERHPPKQESPSADVEGHSQFCASTDGTVDEGNSRHSEMVGAVVPEGREEPSQVVVPTDGLAAEVVLVASAHELSPPDEAAPAAAVAEGRAEPSPFVVPTDGPATEVVLPESAHELSPPDEAAPASAVAEGRAEPSPFVVPTDGPATEVVLPESAPELDAAAERPPSVEASPPTTPEESAVDGGEVLPPLFAPTNSSGADARFPDEEPVDATPTPAPTRSRRGKGRGSRRRGSAHSVSGTEVAFILDANVDGFVRTERVSLVHVVKLVQRGEGQWEPHFRIGREHIDTMLARTESAFCLFLVPPVPRAECWLLPARLVRELMEAQRSLTSVPRDAVARAARSFSQWWLGDFASLWTGDTRPSLLAHASSHAPDAPDFVVRWSLHSGERPGRT